MLTKQETAADAAPEEPRRRQWPSQDEFVAIALVTLVYVVLAALAIRWSIRHHLITDFRTHANNAALSTRLGIEWPHFLSYWVMSAPAGFSTRAATVLGSLPVVVAVLLGAKFVISYAMLRSGDFGARRRGVSTVGVGLLLTIALLLSFTFNLPVPNLFRGQLSPNQWHNTTTMVVMPFALWTFWAACAFMRKPSRRGAIWIAVAGVLSVTTKPNFAMAFVPAFPVHLYFSGLSRRWKVVGLTVTGVIAVVLLAQYGYMYHSAEFAHLRRAALFARGQPDVKWGLRIAPFSLWSDVSPFIPLSIVASLLFPFVAVLARPAAARKSAELRLAWLLFGFALLAFITFDETGRIVRAANFRWGGIVTLFILFLVSVAMLLEPRKEGESRAWDRAAWTAFGLHVASGIFVLVVFARTHSYLQLHWSQVFDRL